MTAKTIAGPVKLSLSYKVIWGIAGLGTALISGTFWALLTIFYQDYIGLEAGLFALAMGIYAVWNAINDPLFGYWSDRTRSRWGRRIPYILFGTAPYVITFALLWMAPFDGRTNPVGLLVYFLVAVISMLLSAFEIWYNDLPEVRRTLFAA